MNKIKLYIRKEPVALAFGAVITALVAYGVSRGIVDESLAPIILAVASLILGVPLARTVRSQVTPQANLKEVAWEYAAPVVEKARGEIVKTYGEQGGEVLDAISTEVDKYIGQHRKP